MVSIRLNRRDQVLVISDACVAVGNQGRRYSSNIDDQNSAPGAGQVRAWRARAGRGTLQDCEISKYTRGHLLSVCFAWEHFNVSTRS